MSPTLSAIPTASLSFPTRRPGSVRGISQPFGWLFPTKGQIPKHCSPVRRSSARIATPVTARLACVRHAASVQSEPGSNSSLEDFELQQKEHPKGPTTCWTYLGHSVFAPKGIDASPHTNYLLIFKEHPGRSGPRKGAGSIALGHIPSTIRTRLISQPKSAFPQRAEGRAV